MGPYPFPGADQVKIEGGDARSTEDDRRNIPSTEFEVVEPVAPEK